MMDQSTVFLLGIVVSLCVIFVSSLALYLSSPSKQQKRSSKKDVPPAPPAPRPAAVKTFTAEEVSKHATATDCWIIVKNKVYDVSSYVEEHPGSYAILNNAGRDSTEGFYGPQHATRVFDMVEEFYIGDLAS